MVFDHLKCFFAFGMSEYIRTPTIYLDSSITEVIVSETDDDATQASNSTIASNNKHPTIQREAHDQIEANDDLTRKLDTVFDMVLVLLFNDFS